MYRVCCRRHSRTDFYTKGDVSAHEARPDHKEKDVESFEKDFGKQKKR
jgi:hypothetical protein